MITNIIFSVDYNGDGHIISVEDKSWIEDQLIIHPNMDNNGIYLPISIEEGLYRAEISFRKGEGWLNGDVYDDDEFYLGKIQDIFKIMKEINQFQ